MPVTIPFAVIGPGRVGTALARRWHEAGLSCLGFVGRDAGRVDDALRFVGVGARLTVPNDLHRAAIVAVTVADGALADVVAEHGARGSVGAGALWFHTSGLHGIGAMSPVADAGGVVGALHPLCPFPDAAAGYAALPGRRALLEAPSNARELLTRVAEAAGLSPVVAEQVDRGLYHATCVLAANGTTGLLGLCVRLLERAARLTPESAAALAADLAGAAAKLTAERGAVAALSGPVRRGEETVVARHRRALHDGAGADAEDAYRVLMVLALELARAAGLDPARAAAVARALAEGEDG